MESKLRTGVLVLASLLIGTPRAALADDATPAPAPADPAAAPPADPAADPPVEPPAEAPKPPPSPAAAASGVVNAAEHGEPISKELNPFVPWYRGEYGNNRIFHLSLTAGLGLVWIASETVFKAKLTASTCRWCEPPGFDRSVRNALVWGNPDRAALLSSIDAYVVAPIVGLGLLVISDYKASWSRIIDDTVPVVETVVISELLTQAVKFSTGRQRPYAHFGDGTTPPTTDDNQSFFSGHSVLGFSITASAGLICHWRHYWTEPYVWGAGIAISLSTEYLRMGADKHYLSDVVVGGVVGLGAGLLVPRLMRRDIKIVPAPHGAALAGTF